MKKFLLVLIILGLIILNITTQNKVNKLSAKVDTLSTWVDSIYYYD